MMDNPNLWYPTGHTSARELTAGSPVMCLFGDCDKEINLSEGTDSLEFYSAFF